MKRIIEICNNSMPLSQRRSHLSEKEGGGDTVKLKMRGRGSGHQETTGNEDQSDHLNIIVSSKYYKIYLVACNHVQELILNVYEEYKSHCAKFIRKTNRENDLKIKKEETILKQVSSSQGPPNIFNGPFTYQEVMQKNPD